MGTYSPRKDLEEEPISLGVEDPSCNPSFPSSRQVMFKFRLDKLKVLPTCFLFGQMGLIAGPVSGKVLWLHVPW